MASTSPTTTHRRGRSWAAPPSSSARMATPVPCRQRHSTPSLGSDGGGARLVKASASVTAVTTTGDHCTFEIHVNTGLSEGTINKRFSEIREFRRALLAIHDQQHHCQSSVCRQLHQLRKATFPHRKLQVRRRADVELACERSEPLQKFLNALLAAFRCSTVRDVDRCVASKCPAIEGILTFFSLPPPAATVASINRQSDLHAAHRSTRSTIMAVASSKQNSPPPLTRERSRSLWSDSSRVFPA